MQPINAFHNIENPKEGYYTKIIPFSSIQIVIRINDTYITCRTTVGTHEVHYRTTKDRDIQLELYFKYLEVKSEGDNNELIPLI